MAANDQPCVFHFPGFNSCNYLVNVSERKWNTAKERAEDWVLLVDDHDYQLIAERVLNMVESMSDNDHLSNLKCHDYCYKKNYKLNNIAGS